MGVFELDTAGTVMYSRVNPNVNAASFTPSSDLVGRNFFDEVAPFKNIEEFRRRFRHFARGSDSAEKFTFTCQFEEHPAEMKVMLTRISEREFDEDKKLIIVDIRFNNS
jgi:photoactive yellow protein